MRHARTLFLVSLLTGAVLGGFLLAAPGRADAEVHNVHLRRLTGGGGGLSEPVTLTQTLTGVAAAFSGTITSSVASASNAYLQATGARLKLGAGTTDYFTSDGLTKITAAGDLRVSNDLTVGTVRPPSVLSVISGSSDGASSTYLEVYSNNAAMSNAGARLLRLYNGNATLAFSVAPEGNMVFERTGADSTASPGAATINKAAGKSAIASGATSAVVTNSTVTANSIVMLTPLDIDATNCPAWSAVPAAGSFTATCSGTLGATWKFSWMVVNR